MHEACTVLNPRCGAPVVKANGAQSRTGGAGFRRQNTTADRIELSAEQVERLNNLTPAAGQRHVEIEDAKAVNTLDAPVAGMVTQFVASSEDTIPVHGVIALIDERHL